MFVLNFVLFFNLFTLVIFMKVDNTSYIVDACVEVCFLKKQFLNLTINMKLLYFITTVTSQVHSARHHQRAGYSCDQPSSFSQAPSACGVQCRASSILGNSTYICNLDF